LRHRDRTGMVDATLAIGGFYAHRGGKRHRKPDQGAIRRLGLVVVTKDRPPVVLLGLELQELYGIDILLFSCRYSKSTGDQLIGLSPQVFTADTAFNRVPGSRGYYKARVSMAAAAELFAWRQVRPTPGPSVRGDRMRDPSRRRPERPASPAHCRSMPPQKHGLEPKG
jgi:hypothetical protein